MQARFARDVDVHANVVDNFAFAGQYFDGRYVVDCVLFCGQDKAAVFVASRGFEWIGCFGFKDQVGCAQGPAFGKCDGFGLVGGVALGHAAIDPLREGLDFGVCESAGIFEVAVFGACFPGWHDAGFNGVAHLIGPGEYFCVVKKGYATDAAGAMTVLAAVLEQGQDIAIKCWGRGVRRGCWPGQASNFTAKTGQVGVGDFAVGEQCIEGVPQAARGRVFGDAPAVVDFAPVAQAVLGVKEKGMGGVCRAEVIGEFVVRVAQDGEGYGVLGVVFFDVLVRFVKIGIYRNQAHAFGGILMVNFCAVNIVF